jgi:hypothetical protein
MVASVVHLVGEGGKEVAGTVDLAGEGGGREEVAEVEEVAGATDRPARRKKRRPSSRRCAGAVVPWTPELHHRRPHRHARRSELPQSSRPELAHHRTIDPVGGPPRHGRATSMRREAGGRGGAATEEGAVAEEEAVRGGVREGAAGGCKMGGVGVLGFRGRKGAPLYMWSGLLGHLGHWDSCWHMGRIVPGNFVPCWAGTMG